MRARKFSSASYILLNIAWDRKIMKKTPSVNAYPMTRLQGHSLAIRTWPRTVYLGAHLQWLCIKESSLQALDNLLVFKKGNHDINLSPLSIMPGNVFWQASLIARIILPWVSANDSSSSKYVLLVCTEKHRLSSNFNQYYDQHWIKLKRICLAFRMMK